jgi:acetyl esterase/lipase
MQSISATGRSPRWQRSRTERRAHASRGHGLPVVLLLPVALLLAFVLPVTGLPVTGLLFSVARVAAAEPIEVPLWPGPAPVGDGSVDGAGKPRITVHIPENPNGAAAVICPGGGYGGLVTGAEGHGIAAWLGRHGIAGIVLEYRLPAGRSAVPFLDAQRAIRTARHRAAEWKLDPARVGIIGFSAGGHLAATAATHPAAGDPAATDPIDRLSGRPAFAILVYPVITMGDAAGTHPGSRHNLLGPEPSAELVRRYSAEQQVTADTSPTFLAHAEDDKPVPIANSVMFHDALVAHGVPTRLLRLPSGGHGLDGYKGPSWDAWQTGAITWLGELGMIR